MMKKIYFLLPVIAFLFGCEDVIEVDLPETETRLVIDGIIRLDTSQTFAQVEVKVHETSGFFEENIPADLESAAIYYGLPLEGSPDLFEQLFWSNLAESEPGSGIYIPDPTFSSDQRIPISVVEPGFVFQLIISHKGRRYFASTPYSQTVPIDNLEQGDETLFDENDTEMKVTITDRPNERNYYVFDFDFGEFLAVDDQFIDGQQFEFSYFYQKDLVAGDQAEISILGADQQFFNYIDLLMEQTLDDGGVFETPATTVRGNIFDITDINNIDLFDSVEQPDIFPLGYFAVVQEYKQTITIE